MLTAALPALAFLSNAAFGRGVPFPIAVATGDLSAGLGVPAWLWPGVVGAVVLMGGAFLVSLVANLARCWEVFRTKPPAHETYATKEELAAMEQRLNLALQNNQSNADHWRGEMTAKVDGLGKTFQSFTNELMRAIGRLEGKAKPEGEGGR